MVSAQLQDELKSRLLDERRRLESEVTSLRSSDTRSDTFLADETDSADQHPADEGSELFEREKNLALVRELQRSLDQVNEALQRMDAGTYGTCARCGKPIPEKRLQALPEAIHDIECQAQIERSLARQIGAPQR
jgi:RNA polymerase-binding transcription factor DksA